MSQQTEDRGQKNNDRFSKLLLQGRLAVLPHRSPSEQFVLTWTGLGAGSGPLTSAHQSLLNLKGGGGYTSKKA